MIAQPLDLEHLAHGRKATGGGFACDQLFDLGVAELGHGATTGTNQELPGMPLARIRAADKGVQRVESVNKTRFDQEIECPIHGRRSRRGGFPAECLQNVIGADRLVTVPDKFEDTLSDRRKPQTAMTAKLFCRCQGGLHTIAMIVG